MTREELEYTRLSQHFMYHELFPKHMCESMAWYDLRDLLDYRIIRSLEVIRQELGKVYVNNWFWGGNSQWRGYRTAEWDKFNSASAHAWGHAVDFNVQGYTAEAVREWILTWQERFLALGITRLESGIDAPTWVHMDVKYTGLDQIKVFRA